MARFLIHIDAQDAQDFSKDSGLAVLDIGKSARDHRRSQPLIHGRRRALMQRWAEFLAASRKPAAT